MDQGGKINSKKRGIARARTLQSKAEDGFKDKVLDLRRVTRVMAGGKRFRFRATVIIGDEKGTVGVGIAKGLDVASAIAKAKTDAQKNLLTINLEKRTIPHEVEAKFSAAKVRLKPAMEGHGLKAGGAVRAVLSLVGVKDITAKCLGRTPNKLTNALATIEALKKLKSKIKRPEIQTQQIEKSTQPELNEAPPKND